MPSLAILAATAATASAANSWSVINQNTATEATGIAFTSDGKTGYLAGGSNGSGAQLLKSVDGGKTWGPTPASGFLFLDVTAYGANVMGSNVFDQVYSNNAGSTWATSTGSAVSAQCSRNFGPQNAPLGFATVGDFGLVNSTSGVGISTNAGATFTDISIPVLQTSARYGSFPDSKHWFVSAGQWPASSSNDQPANDQPTHDDQAAGSIKSATRHLSERVSIHAAKNADGTVEYHREFSTAGRVVKGAGALRGARALQGGNLPNNTYAGQIAATTDGGKTWTSQFFTEDFYFNGIDCANANNCCAVAENDGGGTSGALGAFIYCTWDAGAHWKMTYNTTTAGASLLDLRNTGNDNGYWAVGGVINGVPEASVFLYSGDYGHTWNVDTVLQGSYASSVECAVTTTECWATVLDATQTASVAYSDATSAHARFLAGEKSDFVF